MNVEGRGNSSTSDVDGRGSGSVTEAECLCKTSDMIAEGLTEDFATKIDGL